MVEEKYRSRIEAAYAEHLEARRLAHEIMGWRYETIKLKVAGRRHWYVPDFMVINADGEVELHEVKGGYVRPLGELKYEAAKERYPMFIWRWVTRGPHKEWIIK